MLGMAKPERDKDLVWLHGEVQAPPFSPDARRRAGFLLRLIQRGNIPPMPHCRPMPSIAPRCHELRVRDARGRVTWRIIFRVDDDVILIADVFAKKTQKTPANVVEACRRRFRVYDS